MENTQYDEGNQDNVGMQSAENGAVPHKVSRLDSVQSELAEALATTKEMIDYLSTTGHLANSGENHSNPNLDRLRGFGSDFLDHLSKAQRGISEEIQNLIHFVPIESTNYGNSLDEALEKQRLEMMADHLEETKHMLQENK